MLQAIRDKAQGWIAWAIVGLISIPFAMWGIQEYLGIGGEPTVAEVDGVEITQAQLDQNIHRYRTVLRERLGAAYNPDMMPNEILRGQVLDSMIRDMVLTDSARDLGLRAGDEMVRERIRAIPAFQRAGHFDPGAYENALRMQGYTPASFEHNMRDDLATSLLENGIRGSALVTDLEMDDYLRVRDQTRDFSMMMVKAENFMGDSAPEAQAIEAYYEQNKGRFIRPERVRIDYLELGRDRVAETVTVDDETLKSYYDEHSAEFTSPEQRSLRHILIPVDGSGEGADAQALATAQDLETRLQAGEDFAELAKTYSKDPGSAANGGDLGLVGRGVMVPAFEEAAFSLDVGAVSEPVRTEFGYHIIRVDRVVPEGVQSFDEARDRVAKLYRQGQAEHTYYEQAERLADLSYEQPDSLVPAAEALGLEIQHSDWVTADGGEGILATPKLIAAAFNEDVLTRGNNSEPIELEPTHMVVLRVVEHEETTTKPLDEVRDQIVDILRNQAAAQKATELGDKLLEAVRAGTSLETVAADNGLELEARTLVDRGASDLPRELVSAVFSAPRPADGATVADAVSLKQGDRVVFVLQKVIDGDPASLDNASRSQLRAELMARRSERDFTVFINEQVAEAKVEIKPQTP